MRKLLYIIGFIIMLASCNDNNEQILPNQKEFTVGHYNQVNIGANVVVVNNAQASGADNGRTTGTSNSSIITVKGQPELVAYISIEAIDGVIYIRTSNEVALEDSITVELNTIDLATIKLEADQHATVHWEAEETIIETLEIKTEANSQLEFFGLKANNVLVKQEAQSSVELTSGWITGLDSIAFEKELVEVINETSALIDEYWYSFSEIDLYVNPNDNKEYYIIKGDVIRAAFIINEVQVTTEATTSFEATEAAVANLDIKLEGESQAKVWVLNHLSGVGKGESILYYRGNPLIDFTVEGAAQLIPLL